MFLKVTITGSIIERENISIETNNIRSDRRHCYASLGQNFYYIAHDFRTREFQEISFDSEIKKFKITRKANLSFGR